MIPLRHNLKQILIAIDQLGNAVLCSLFEPHVQVWADESLSAHAWRWEINGVRHWPRKLIDGLLFFDKNHCQESYKSEVLRRQAPPETR